MYCSHITTWREVRLRTCCPRPHKRQEPLRREVQDLQQPLQREAQHLRNQLSISTSASANLEESETSGYSSFRIRSLVFGKNIPAFNFEHCRARVRDRDRTFFNRHRRSARGEFFIKNRIFQQISAEIPAKAQSAAHEANFSLKLENFNKFQPISAASF